MKKIIEKIIYDTEKATHLATRKSHSFFSPERLYKGKNKFFIISENSYDSNLKVTPITFDEAVEFYQDELTTLEISFFDIFDKNRFTEA